MRDFDEWLTLEHGVEGQREGQQHEDVDDEELGHIRHHHDHDHPPEVVDHPEPSRQWDWVEPAWVIESVR